MNSNYFFLLVLVTIVHKSGVSLARILQPKIGHMLDCGRPVVVADPKRSRKSRYNEPQYPKIIGGEVANELSWPWQGLFMGFIPDSNRFIFCGATLISTQWLITAAHCVDMEFSRATVHLGINLFSQATRSNELEVEKIFKNNFNPNTLSNDIALIKLKNPIRFSDRIRPVCLSDENLAKVNESVVITGWGLIKRGQNNEDNVLPNELFQVKIPVVDTSLCSGSSSEICGGVIGTSPKGSCFGDSGGPMVIRKDNRFYIVGVVSFGNGMCDGFSGYTRVWSYNSWIQDTIKNN